MYIPIPEHTQSEDFPESSDPIEVQSGLSCLPHRNPGVHSPRPVSYTHLAALKPGAIDHVAIDVKNIEKVHEMITGAGLNTTQDEVHFLPFWENGVRFFTIEGPNKEKVEFSQYL